MVKGHLRYLIDRFGENLYEESGNEDVLDNNSGIFVEKNFRFDNSKGEAFCYLYYEGIRGNSLFSEYRSKLSSKLNELFARVNSLNDKNNYEVSLVPSFIFSVPLGIPENIFEQKKVPLNFYSWKEWSKISKRDFFDFYVEVPDKEIKREVDFFLEGFLKNNFPQGKKKKGIFRKFDSKREFFDLRPNVVIKDPRIYSFNLHRSLDFN